MSHYRIVYGDINGQFVPVFKKLTNLHAKTGFAFALVAGNLFGTEVDEAIDDLLDNKIPIPLPVYFTVGTQPFPQKIIDKLEASEELCENLHFLGKRTTTKTSERIKIVTLGGMFDASITSRLSEDKFSPSHTLGDAKALYGANTADILLTASWPASIQRYSKIVIPEGVTPPEGSEHISELCAALRPRYHFSASSNFAYEREPFFHTPSVDTPDVKPITRFISIAPHGNPAKAKALYAFSLATTVDHAAALPADVTPAPFAKVQKRKALEAEPYSRYRGDDRNGHRDNKRGRGRRGERQPPPGPGECFFCLSNPTLATHLISSIGDDAYLTMSKGPLTTFDTYKDMGLDFPAHTIIIPLTHAPTLSSITEEDNAKQKTYAEMNRFKEAIQSMVADRSNNKLGVVTFEISKRAGVHTHWQCLPMPADMIQKNLVEAAFRVEGENREYPQFITRDPGISENEGDFIRVWIWTPPSDDSASGSTKCITMPFDDTFRFDLQFGRAVLAKLLGIEKRIHWKDCEQTIEEETKETELFKEAFKHFDFTL